MDDGELDFPSDHMLSCLDLPNASSCSFDIEEFLGRTQSCNETLGRTEACTDGLGRTQACTHAHACNTSGPDKSHTHTCIHVHTQIMPTGSGDEQDPSDDTAESVEKKGKKRPLGNREAVRKYREKKKARNALLEDEVVRLKALNQHLMKRLQGQALLEAEVARLKCLLVDIRGRIEGEIGSFPYQKPAKSRGVYQNVANPNVPGTYVMNPCNMQRNEQLYCLHPGSEGTLDGQGLGDCGFDDLQCFGDQNSGRKELPDYGMDNVNSMSTGNTSSSRKRKGSRAATAC